MAKNEIFRILTVLLKPKTRQTLLLFYPHIIPWQSLGLLSLMISVTVLIIHGINKYFFEHAPYTKQYFKHQRYSVNSTVPSFLQLIPLRGEVAVSSGQKIKDRE